MSEGKTTIAPDVLNTIARMTTLSVPGVNRLCAVPHGVNRILSRSFNDGVRIEIQDDIVLTDIYVVMNNNVNIRDVSRNIQQQVSRALSEMVGMHIGYINIHVEDIEYSQAPEKLP